MAWLRYIGGRIKSDYRYSVGLVLNTFPWPEATAQQKGKITNLAQRILDARANYSSSTLADLYDPEVMPAPLPFVRPDSTGTWRYILATAPFGRQYVTTQRMGLKP